MILSNVNIIGKEGFHHILVKGEKIISVFHQEDIIPVEETVIDCQGGLAFPGLINSHDHLDFNLFPHLRNRVYKNYTEWGNDIHQHNKQEIEDILKIPLPLRVQWGIYKNLLNGITTVVNHGERLQIENDLITVFQDCYSLHSPAFEKNWRWKLNFRKRKLPVVMHIGEGTDDRSSKEIDQVIQWNFFKRKVIAVHGVAMNKEQASKFKALVWCPDSNYFLLGRTADIHELKSDTKILFGTDSTLSASWNAWEHFRLAREQGGLTDQELFNSLTKNAAEVWDLNNGELFPQKDADIIVALKNKNDRNSFFEIDPEDILLVIRKGDIKLFDKRFHESLNNRFTRVSINDNDKFILGDLESLTRETKKYYSDLSFPFAIDKIRSIKF